MNLYKYFSLNKDHFIFIILIVLSSYLLFSNKSPKVIELKYQISNISSKILYPKVWYKNILEIREKNYDLLNEVTRLSLLNAQLDNFRIENEKLKEMLNFSASNPLSLISANVTNYSFGVSAKSITIDIGSNRNLIKDLPILNQNGLLGKTILVGNEASLVQLINDKNFRVSVRLGSKGDLGIFVPTHGKYGIIEGVPKSTPIIIDDIVYTSGISEIYPANIPVAKVISFQIKNNRPFKNIVVELLADLQALDYVFVVQ